jgi:hypothetical protein
MGGSVLLACELGLGVQQCKAYSRKIYAVQCFGGGQRVIVATDDENEHRDKCFLPTLLVLFADNFKMTFGPKLISRD